MLEQGPEPRLRVERERALQHALFTVRRAWAGGVPDFEAWGGLQLNPEPLIIHDLNGQILFYEFDAMRGNRPAGSVKASASRLLGPAVLAVELRPRRWDPARATRQAQDEAKKRFPRATVTNAALVCYNYPKIGVRVDLEISETEHRSLIFDAGDLTLVERFGADELEGYAAYSFYRDIAEPQAQERQRRWELADAELEAARAVTPNIFAPGFTARELPRVRSSFVLESPFTFISFYSSQTIKYAPRCSPHDCFADYAQQTNVYCAVATGQMILDFYRYYFTQDQIATAMGTGPGGTGNDGQVQGYQSLSNNCLVATFDGTASWTEAKAEIDANRPLKSGIPGHARACAGWMRQNITLIGQQPKRWLRIYDPWPWNADICQGGAIVWEDWETVNHTNFIYVRHRTTPCG